MPGSALTGGDGPTDTSKENIDCKYCSTDDAKAILDNDKTSLSMLHVNSRSIKRNFDKLKATWKRYQLNF